jgi:hypothetical protein
MPYVMRKSHQMQKHNFGVMCPDMLFMKTTPAPLEHEKLCIDVSRPGRTRMHYVSRGSHRMQKKVWCNVSDSFSVESVLVPHEHQK